MKTYVAFLRGIGGTNTKIKMQVLKEAFEGMGFQNVRTVRETPKTRPFVTFVKEPPRGRVRFSGKGFKVLGKKGRAVLSFVNASGGEAPELMRLLDKEFGKQTTTWSWKTIEKILER